MCENVNWSQNGRERVDFKLLAWPRFFFSYSMWMCENCNFKSGNRDVNPIFFEIQILVFLHGTIWRPLHIKKKKRVVYTVLVHHSWLRLCWYDLLRWWSFVHFLNLMEIYLLYFTTMPMIFYSQPAMPDTMAFLATLLPHSASCRNAKRLTSIQVSTTAIWRPTFRERITVPTNRMNSVRNQFQPRKGGPGKGVM